jgi:hypothetical protein
MRSSELLADTIGTRPEALDPSGSDDSGRDIQLPPARQAHLLRDDSASTAASHSTTPSRNRNAR